MANSSFVLGHDLSRLYGTSGVLPKALLIGAQQKVA